MQLPYFLISLMLSLFFLGCDDGAVQLNDPNATTDETGAEQRDGPRRQLRDISIVEVSTQQGEDCLLPNDEIVLELDAAIDEDTLRVFLEQKVKATEEWFPIDTPKTRSMRVNRSLDETRRIIRLTPERHFEPGKTYKVVLDNAFSVEDFAELPGPIELNLQSCANQPFRKVHFHTQSDLLDTITDIHYPQGGLLGISTNDQDEVTKIRSLQRNDVPGQGTLWTLNVYEKQDIEDILDPNNLVDREPTQKQRISFSNQGTQTNFVSSYGQGEDGQWFSEDDLGMIRYARIGSLFSDYLDLIGEENATSFVTFSSVGDEADPFVTGAGVNGCTESEWLDLNDDDINDYRFIEYPSTNPNLPILLCNHFEGYQSMRTIINDEFGRPSEIRAVDADGRQTTRKVFQYNGNITLKHTFVGDEENEVVLLTEQYRTDANGNEIYYSKCRAPIETEQGFECTPDTLIETRTHNNPRGIVLVQEMSISGFVTDITCFESYFEQDQIQNDYCDN